MSQTKFNKILSPVKTHQLDSPIIQECVNLTVQRKCNWPNGGHNVSEQSFISWPNSRVSFRSTDWCWLLVRAFECFRVFHVFFVRIASRTWNAWLVLNVHISSSLTASSASPAPSLLVQIAIDQVLFWCFGQVSGFSRNLELILCDRKQKHEKILTWIELTRELQRPEK